MKTQDFWMCRACVEGTSSHDIWNCVKIQVPIHCPECAAPIEVMGGSRTHVAELEGHCNHWRSLTLANIWKGAKGFNSSAEYCPQCGEPHL
jgi:hypothetical protein